MFEFDADSIGGGGGMLYPCLVACSAAVAETWRWPWFWYRGGMPAAGVAGVPLLFCISCWNCCCCCCCSATLPSVKVLARLRGLVLYPLDPDSDGYGECELGDGRNRLLESL